ncbi:aromatic amino acid lyase [Gemmobacter serpentinus]|uniref:aromatic amino acid lyase n=1 Tax=Gemmobacter serpentinus TaxID=2652247 RepID=UPI00124EA524|nr:aromatic amino acid lyase [Gemmobacter serpentinus]
MTRPPCIMAFDYAPLDMAALRMLLAGRVSPQISAAAMGRVAKGRQVLERAIAAGQPIYGATTGVGAMKCTEHRDAGAILQFNTSLALAHQVAVGEVMPDGIARLTLALRLNTALSGRVGVSEGFVRHLAAMLHHDLLPVLHGRGSVGCADLGQMGELASVMVGEGAATLAGLPLPADVAYAQAGLQPYAMQPRDSLAAISTNAFGLARCAAAVARAAEVIRQAMTQAAVTAAAWGLDRAVWQAALESHIPGEAEMAAWLQAALDDQQDWPARSTVHDALSGRFLVQILTASVAAASTAARSVTRHTTQIDDNPVICGDKVVTSGASLLCDLSASVAGLQLALSQLGRNVFNRCLILTNGGLPGLPVNLVPPGRIATGYGPLMKLAQEQALRINLAAQPVVPLNLTLAAGLEDEALLIPLAAERLLDQLEALDWLLTIEALLAVQALDLRGLAQGRMLAMQAELVRRHIAPLSRDVPLSAPLSALRENLRMNEVRAGLRALAPFPAFDQEMGFSQSDTAREDSALCRQTKEIAQGDLIQ